MTMIGWLRIKQAAEYCCVCERTVRSWTKREGLRFSKLRGTIFIKVEWLDSFLESYAVEVTEVDRIVDEVTEEMGVFDKGTAVIKIESSFMNDGD